MITEGLNLHVSCIVVYLLLDQVRFIACFQVLLKLFKKSSKIIPRFSGLLVYLDLKDRIGNFANRECFVVVPQKYI